MLSADCRPQVFSSPQDITRELAAAEALLAALNRVLNSLPTSIEQDEQLIATASASASQPSSPGRRLGTSSKRRDGGSTSAGSGSNSDSGMDAATEAETDIRVPMTSITTARALGIVEWRLELKRVWRQMAGMVQEYRDGLAVAEVAVAAAAGSGEPVAI